MAKNQDGTALEELLRHPELGQGRGCASLDTSIFHCDLEDPHRRRNGIVGPTFLTNHPFSYLFAGTRAKRNNGI
jgi:hypothetical protein